MIQAKIEKAWCAQEVNLHLRLKEGRDRLAYVPVKLQLDLKEYEPGEEIKPFLKVDGLIADEFFEALAQALAEAGYGKQFFNSQEKGAVLNHLEDMRKLVFKGGEK